MRVLNLPNTGSITSILAYYDFPMKWEGIMFSCSASNFLISVKILKFNLMMQQGISGHNLIRLI